MKRIILALAASLGACAAPQPRALVLIHPQSQNRVECPTAELSGAQLFFNALQGLAAGLQGRPDPNWAQFQYERAIAQQCEMSYRSLGYRSEGSAELEAAIETRNRDIGLLARNIFNAALESIADLARADQEIRLMVMERGPEKIKYHYVQAENHLQSAKLKIESLRVTRKGSLTEELALPVFLAVEKKAQAVGYVLKGERGAAVASDKFANDQVVEALLRILGYTKVNKYIYGPDEIAKLTRAKDAWQALSASDPDTEMNQERAKYKEVSF